MNRFQLQGLAFSPVGFHVPAWNECKSNLDVIDKYALNTDMSGEKRRKRGSEYKGREK
jgi:hypothetical protein